MATYLDEDILNLYAMEGDEVPGDDAIDEADLPEDDDDDADDE
jgi:hypothetical protein